MATRRRVLLALINASQTEPSIPNNQIWYTTSDGNVVTLSKTTVFGANIISNTYNNGKGVITFDGNVTTIGSRAFYNCYRLTSVTIPDSVTSIGYDAFYRCSMTSVTIPDSVTTIGNGAFSFCDNLKEFTGKYAADGGRCLIIDNTIIAYAEASGTTYTIPDSVTSIGGEAFFQCYNLRSVTIPDSVTTINESAFEYCDSLTSVTIGDSVTAIGNYVFNSCDSLKDVYCKPITPPTLWGSYVFNGNTSDRKIYVPAGSVEAYKSADGWSEYASAIVGYNFEDEE